LPRKRWLVVIAAAVLCFSAIAYAALVTFTSHTTFTAADLNTNFGYLNKIVTAGNCSAGSVVNGFAVDGTPQCSSSITSATNATNATNVSGGTVSGSGAGLTSLNGSNVTSGTVVDSARLGGFTAAQWYPVTSSSTPVVDYEPNFGSGVIVETTIQASITPPRQKGLFMVSFSGICQQNKNGFAFDLKDSATGATSSGGTLSANGSAKQDSFYTTTTAFIGCTLFWVEPVSDSSPGTQHTFILRASAVGPYPETARFDGTLFATWWPQP
jgi:hypothetical protein